MNLKDILIHIDHRPTCASRLEVALQLAKQQQSQLTGIYVIPHPHFTAHHPKHRNLVQEAEHHFRQQAQIAGVPCDWICVDSLKSGLNVVNAINLYAHYRDLLVLSQTDEEKPDRAIPDNLPEMAVLGSGRPVLMVPYAGTFNRQVKLILLAWRGGPESARSLHDAMPVLRKAEHVKVITVQGRAGDDAYQSHEADICKHMTRYQLPLSCEKRITGDDLSVGDLLLNRCAEYGADLLVVGATSQFRRGYQTLGETGRNLLKCMTVPVLMSH